MNTLVRLTEVHTNYIMYVCTDMHTDKHTANTEEYKSKLTLVNKTAL